jgi:hypothetical protein
MRYLFSCKPVCLPQLCLDMFVSAMASKNLSNLALLLKMCTENVLHVGLTVPSRLWSGWALGTALTAAGGSDAVVPAAGATASTTVSAFVPKSAGHKVVSISSANDSEIAKSTSLLHLAVEFGVLKVARWLVRRAGLPGKWFNHVDEVRIAHFVL